jgi:hypothetical protein
MASHFTLAQIEPTGPGAAAPQRLTVSTPAVTILVAVITIVPPIVSALIDRTTKSSATEAQLTQQANDLAFKREERETSLLRPLSLRETTLSDGRC